MNTQPPDGQQVLKSEDIYLRFSSTDINTFIETVPALDLAKWKQLVCNEHEWDIDVVNLVNKVSKLAGDRLIKFMFGVVGLHKSAIVIDPSIDIDLLTMLINPVLRDWNAVKVMDAMTSAYVVYSTRGNVANDVCMSVIVAYSLVHPFLSDADWAPLIDSWIDRNKYIQITK